MQDYSPPRALNEDDDPVAFDCGRASLNAWLCDHAFRNQLSGASRTTIIYNETDQRIAGFVSLCTAQIIRGYLPKKFQRNMPAAIPALLLGQLAVDTRDQNRRIASSLLVYAFNAALRIANEAGCYALLTQPLDASVREFYHRNGFADLPGDPHGAMFIRIVDIAKSKG